MHEVGLNAKRALLTSAVCVILVVSNIATAGASTAERTSTTQSARSCWVFCW